MVKLSRLNAAAIHIRHAAKPHAKGCESQPGVIVGVVQAVMVMTMKRLADTQAAGEFVNGFKAMWVRAGCLVRHQDIGTLRHQTKVVLGEDGAAVLAR